MLDGLVVVAPAGLARSPGRCPIDGVNFRILEKGFERRPCQRSGPLSGIGHPSIRLPPILVQALIEQRVASIVFSRFEETRSKAGDLGADLTFAANELEVSNDLGVGRFDDSRNHVEARAWIRVEADLANLRRQKQLGAVRDRGNCIRRSHQHLKRCIEQGGVHAIVRVDVEPIDRYGSERLAPASRQMAYTSKQRTVLQAAAGQPIVEAVNRQLGVTTSPCRRRSTLAGFRFFAPPTDPRA